MSLTKVPILADKLSLPERASLTSLTHHPGFPVLIRLFEVATEDARQDVDRVDPEKEGYDRILAARHQCSRYTNQAFRRVLDSIEYHIAILRQQQPAEAVVDEIDNATQGN